MSINFVKSRNYRDLGKKKKIILFKNIFLNVQNIYLSQNVFYFESLNLEKSQIYFC